MTEPVNRRQTNLLLIVILSLYILLAAGYGMVNPLFEAPDEIHHFFAVRYIAQTKSLPVTASASYLERQEAAQPPLYYMLASLLVAPIDTSKAEEQLWFNPKVLAGREQPINVNTQVHTNAHSWPWQEYLLAAHLVRGFSTIIGLGTLLSIFGSGRLIWPRLPAVALLATALAAFLPQFGFLHGAVTNDVLVIFFASFVLWQLIWLWHNEITMGRMLLLGVSIGLAVLSKMAGLLLLPLALLVLTLIAWRDHRNAADGGRTEQVGWWKDLLLPAALVITAALLLSGWLLWRNWINYGDVTAANQFISIAGGNRHFTLRQVWNDMDRVAYSAVAFFGWMNVLAPPWLYAIWAAISVLGGGGWLFALLRKRDEPGEAAQKSPEDRLDDRLLAFWLGVWVFLVAAAWLRFMMQTPADQGRLMFPALLPAALFLARGIGHWRVRWLLPVVALCALATSAYALIVLIPSTYNTTEIVTEQQISPQAARISHDMGYGMELLAIEPVTETVQPGEWAWVDLYWRASEPLEEAPLQALALHGREHELAGQQNYYHGGGNNPASEWPLGQIVKDRIAVQLAPDAHLPVQLRLLLDIDGQTEPVEIARFKGVPAQWPQASGATLATMDEGIDLLSVSFSPQEAAAGSVVEVATRWQVTEAPDRDLTTFVHLGDPEQAPLAQGDAPPLSGEYPTGLWAAGEVIDDHYTLNLAGDLAPGVYPIHIGFYDPQSGERVALHSDGQAQPNNAYFAGTLTVEAK